MAVTSQFCDFATKTKGGVGIVVPEVAFGLGSGTLPAGRWGVRGNLLDGILFKVDKVNQPS